MEGICFGAHAIEMEFQVSPVDMFSVLSENYDDCFLLESSEGPEKSARFSFLGFGPEKKITLKNGVVTTDKNECDAANPIEELRREVGRDSNQGEGFIGGAIGYFSFDYVRYMEGLNNNIPDALNFPDYEFGIFSDVVVFDHRKNNIRYLYKKENRMGEMVRHIRDSNFESRAVAAGKARCNITKEKFCENVAAAKEKIKAGEIFQVVLSKRYEIEYSGDLLSFYKKLKATNPSPYMFCLKFGERQVIGSSPENLLRVEGRNISSYATLAGTRPRGKTPEEDRNLWQELLNDEKECAEHMMLVDLTRNDIGKVAEAGTVRVPELMHIHKYSHVQHMASLVTGKLKHGMDAFDAFNAIFPAGTVSGAPKLRAMEIIDRLEGAKRGPYAGAVGYFSANGNSDFAISIRALFAGNGTAHVQAGAGIVYDSEPEKEFMETENKGMALMDALGVRR